MIDLRERAGRNPIAQALQQIIERKRQSQQDRQMNGQIVVAEGKTWLVDRRTGEKIDLGITPPKGKVKGRAIADIINDMAKLSGAAETIPELGIPTARRGMRSLADEAMLETQPEMKKVLAGEAVTPPKEQAVWHEGAPTRPRKRVESKVRPPKPKEYPDAKWSEEHQMWTVVRNGRLKGIE